MSDPSDKSLRKLIREIHRRSPWQVLVIFPLLVLTFCTHQTEVSRATSVGGPRTESERLNAWFDQEFERQLDLRPEFRTQLGDKKDYDRLGDASEEAFDEILELYLNQNQNSLCLQINYPTFLTK